MACRAGIILLLLGFSLSADVYSPWTGIDKLPVATVYGGYWNLGHLPQKSAHNVWIQGFDFDLALDIDLEMGFDFEFAETDRDAFLYNRFDFSFSKLLMNDLIGDPISVMLSLNITNVGGRALAQPALIHFGEWEWRAILAVGKEWTRCFDWWFRISGFFSFGIANRGTPWLEEGFAFEQKLNATGHYMIGIKGIEVFGSHLIKNTPFNKGWGPYEFYAISAVAGYWETICDTEVGIVVESTVWTANFYTNVTKLWLEWRVPLAF